MSCQIGVRGSVNGTPNGFQQQNDGTVDLRRGQVRQDEIYAAKHLDVIVIYFKQRLSTETDAVKHDSRGFKLGVNSVDQHDVYETYAYAWPPPKHAN